MSVELRVPPFLHLVNLVLPWRGTQVLEKEEKQDHGCRWRFMALLGQEISKNRGPQCVTGENVIIELDDRLTSQNQKATKRNT